MCVQPNRSYLNSFDARNRCKPKDISCVQRKTFPRRNFPFSQRENTLAESLICERMQFIVKWIVVGLISAKHRTYAPSMLLATAAITTQRYNVMHSKRQENSESHYARPSWNETRTKYDKLHTKPTMKDYSTTCTVSRSPAISLSLFWFLCASFFFKKLIIYQVAHVFILHRHKGRVCVCLLVLRVYLYCVLVISLNDYETNEKKNEKEKNRQWI